MLRSFGLNNVFLLVTENPPVKAKVVNCLAGTDDPRPQMLGPGLHHHPLPSGIAIIVEIIEGPHAGERRTVGPGDLGDLPV